VSDETNLGEVFNFLLTHNTVMSLRILLVLYTIVHPRRVDRSHRSVVLCLRILVTLKGNTSWTQPRRLA
jgi:hypothetical protein